MAKSNKYWDKRALQRLDDAEKQSEEYIKRIKKMYDKAFKDIDKEIEKVYRNYSKDTGLDVQKLKELLTRSQTAKEWEQLKRQGLDKYVKANYKARISRLEQVQAQIYAKAKLLARKEQLEHTNLYKGIINDSYYKVMYDTQMGTGYDFSFSRIDENMTNVLLNEPWSGANYSTRIWGNTDILAESLSELLGSALLSGQSLSKTVKEVRERFDVSKYYAERLIRTETNHFNNMADAMAFQELGVEYYVFSATLDNRTSEKCQNMDGKKFRYSEKKEGVNFPPLHPNCRSKHRGYIDEEYERDLMRKARNPVTGKVEYIPNMTYKEWAEKNGLSVKPVKPKAIKLKDVPNEVKDWVNADKLPSSFKHNKDTDILVDWLNKNGNPSSKASKVFSSKYKDIATGKEGYSNMIIKSTDNYKKGKFKRGTINYYTGECIPTIEVPTLKGYDNPTGRVNTIIHEHFHSIDFSSTGLDNYSTITSKNSSLKEAVKNYNNKIGDDMSELFNKYNTSCDDIRKTIKEQFSPKFTDVTDRYKRGELKSYDAYSRAWNKLNKERNNIIDLEERNALGGGVDLLQDIYDSLSSGYYKDTGVVKYGHGRKYFRQRPNYEGACSEIFANYGALSMTNPKLVEMLKKDQPALVKALEECMDEILKGGK